MKTVINIHERRFPSVVAKEWIEVSRGSEGKKLASQTWVNWRRWAGVTNGAKYLSWEQLCKLAAIAAIRRDGSNRELDMADINRLAKSPELQEDLAQAVKDLDSKGILGYNIPTYLYAEGIVVKTYDLYNKMKDFSLKATYQEDQLRVFH